MHFPTDDPALHQRHKIDWSLLLLVLVYGATRLTNLPARPIFPVEAPHIAWARHLRDGGASAANANGRLAAVVLFAGARHVQDPLWATRAIVVVAGLITCVGCYVLGKQLFGARVGRVAALLDIVAPLSLLHDRMALADPMAAAVVIGIIITSVHVARGGRPVA